jgi:predicted anti-sigma-YlaC factor YlaD
MTDLSHISPCDPVRDILPEYARGNLVAADVLTVQAHLAQCDACRVARDAMYELQQMSLRAPLIATKRIDAIVSALPAPPTAASRAALPPTIARYTAWRSRLTTVRMAATLAVMLTGAVSWGMWQMRTSDIAVPLSDTPTVAMASDAVGSIGQADVWDVEHTSTYIAPAVLPMQALSEFSDAELEQLLAHIDAWDGAPAASTDAVLNTKTNGASLQPNTLDQPDTIDLSRSDV